ncbi:hypothetical protein U0C78_02875 [Enterococcus durans]|uniref:hypothetical protein n=1 Tax=Enterococcus durans TaxID=53345 RepID=UPI002FDC00D3
MNKQNLKQLILATDYAGTTVSKKFKKGFREGMNTSANMLDQLDEPQKLKTEVFKHDEKFVVEWLDHTTEYHYSLYNAINDAGSELRSWMKIGFNSNRFARAFMSMDYEVEKEPKWKIINDQKYCLTSIEAGYGNSLHWAFDSTKKRPILFDNEETAMYTAYITGGIVEKVEV